MSSYTTIEDGERMPAVVCNQPPRIPATAGSITVFSSLQLEVENVMPGIYLSKNFIAWNEENLRAHGFTHIIIIDKHIQELYYPSPIFKLSIADTFETSAFEDYCQPSTTSLTFGKEFEVIDLNFGEKSYLTTVLPNCYRAVRFINKALQAGGTILVIDCNAGEQKCLTIVVAYLMFKHNISFNHAFARVKEYYKKADLDRFYTSQLYEYEPILQVQRAQSRGHSCSRELHSAILKRKKIEDDTTCISVDNGTDKLFDTLNPLNQFMTLSDESVAETTSESTSAHQQSSRDRSYYGLGKEQLLEYVQEQRLPQCTSSDSVWDDCAME